MKKKIMFVHYRTGERDGVSLEIEKRADIFREEGHEVYYLSGYDPRADRKNTRFAKSKNVFVIPEFDMKRRLAAFLHETYFDERILDKTLAWLLYQSEEEKIYNQVVKVMERVRPDVLFVHNLFSMAFHLPASTALLKALDFYPAKVIAVHHDFWWERGFFKTPRYLFLKSIITNMPPRREYITHHKVINSLAKESLLENRGIESEQMGDSFDFSMPVPPIDDFNKDFLQHFGISPNDIVVLHATRIVPRKAIENAIYFVQALEKRIKKTKPFMFHGKKITKDSRVVLVLPNFSDVDTADYLENIKILAEKLNVRMLIITDDVALERFKENGYKKYSFWDTYTFSDFITYTSFWEGYGNQLLEAFWAKRIPLVFEYPVYKKDIKHEGYQVISLGDKMRKNNEFNLVPLDKIGRAADQALDVLQNEKGYKEIAEHNFKIASELHGYKQLKKDLEEIIEGLD